MRRIAVMVSVLAVLLLDAPAVRASGGGNPPPFIIMTVNPAINATILIDPHMAGVTTTAKKAWVSLRSGTITTQATFDIPSSFPLVHGCDLSLTDTRFLLTAGNGTTLRSWVPPLVLEALFVPFGITLDLVALPFMPPSPGLVQTTPVITQISSAQCIADPVNLNPLLGPDYVPVPPAGPGWLLMHVTIQFAVPAN